MANESSADRAAAPVNVLLIQTDQQRWDALGCAGNPDLRTPHLDAIAADGVRYANSYCSFPVCTPSRYSLLSGLYVHQHMGWSNRNTLPAGLGTFAKQLRAAGYRTAAVGKMHFTPTYLDVGFDRMELAEQNGEGRLDDDYHRDLMAHGLIDLDDAIDQRSEFRARASDEYWRTFGAMRSNLPEEWHSTTWIGDRAVRALEQWDPTAGNVLYASFIKPHHPFDPPAPWDQMYDPASLMLLPGWTDAVPTEDDMGRGYFPNEKLDEPTLRLVMAHYYSTISHIDQQVGRMVAVLKRRGLYDRTLIVFTADHGEYLGFHHLLLKGGRMYEPLTRVPLLIKYPQHAQPSAPGGEVRRTLVSNVDVAPTILRACGLAPHPQLRGLDLADPASDREAVFVEGGRGGRYMVRTRNHKLLLAPEPAQTGFYDLEDDPLELDNRYDDPACQDAVRELRNRLANWMLFDAPTPSYVDDRAPIVDAPNVPPDLQGDFAARDARRRRMLDFYEQQMREHARK